jgi:hypothetical protein
MTGQGTFAALLKERVGIPVFLLAGSAYIVSIAVIPLLAPRLAVVVLD